MWDGTCINFYPESVSPRLSSYLNQRFTLSEAGDGSSDGGEEDEYNGVGFVWIFGLLIDAI